MSETPPSAGIFVQMPDEIRGPFGVDVLLQLVDGGAISQETLVADLVIGPWIPLGRHDIAGELFQPKRVFVLKPAEIHCVNTTDSPPVDHYEILRMANQGSSGCQKAASVPAKPSNDVEALVRETTLANAAREAPLIFVRRVNRRRRDYLFLIGAGNGIGVVLIIILRHIPLGLLGVVSLMTVYTVLVTLIMWVII